MITPDKLPTYYNAGTASVEAGQAAITLTGAAWYSTVWGDDLFYLPSQPLVPPQRIAQVNPDGSAVLAYPWPGATATDVAYEVRYVGMIERSTAQSRRVLEQLGDVKSWADVFVATDADRLALESPTNPLPAGRRVLVIATGLIWVKKTGAYNDWLPPAAFKGDQGDPGPYTDISFGPVTTLPAGQPATATEVDIGPGQKRIDLGLPKGLDGTGTGNVVGPASSVDNHIAVFDGLTGKALKGGGRTIAELAPANNSITNAQLADMASGAIKGRATAGVGDPEDLTAAQLLNLLKTVGAYAKDNILGLVSQAAGVPTGAIIERGSNANGSYVRFADGTQTCSMYNQAGTSGGALTWVFPAAFVVAPSGVFGTGIGTVPKFVTHEIPTANSVVLRVFNQAGGQDTSWLSLKAEGRWF